MTTGKIFFSYSRKDSAFVLKLAKDLRDAGVDLWLDQLDIKPGSHWDSSIQAALNKAHSLIIVLSQSSVESENVMDEVSFALHNKKTVIPVYISECSPPFRLMRLQRIDFTGDYQTGLDHLLETVEQESNSGDNTENSNKEEQTDISNDREKSLREKKDKELERLLWEKAQKEHSLNAYNHYIEEYPAGVFKTEALAKIKSIKDGAKNQETLKSKKYLYLGGGIVVLALVAWGITQFGQKQKTPIDPPKINVDSINAAKAAKEKQDSINRVKNEIGLGKKFQGGIIFYIDQTGQHGLIMAQGDLTTKPIKWSDAPIVKAGAFDKGIFEGKMNTETIVNKNGQGDYPAWLCYKSELNGYKDWYLPSQEELDELYNYNNHQGFTKEYYWSSTEISDKDVYYRSFFNGNKYYWIKGNKALVRAIRRF